MRVALGMLDPGIEFYEATCDGKGEAQVKKVQRDISRGW